VVAEVGEYFKACLKAGERLPAPSPLLMTMDRTRRALNHDCDDGARLHLLHALSGLRLALCCPAWNSSAPATSKNRCPMASMERLYDR
jgi:hypothetical protein